MSSKLVLPNDRPPLFVGAGVIKSAEQIETYAAIPEIAVQVMGSYSYNEHGGNDPEGTKRVTFWDEANQAFYNAVGLKNIGHKAASEFLPESIRRVRAAGQLAIVSVTPIHGENPLVVLPDLAEWALEMGADGVEINGACPNDGHKVLCNDVHLTTSAIDKTRRRIGAGPYLIAKFAPMGKEAIRLYKALSPPIDGATVINNCRRQAPINVAEGGSWIEVKDGYAGESGPIIAGLGREQLRIWRDKTIADSDFRPDVWAIGGIGNGVEAFLRVQLLGAFAAGGAQAFYRSSDPSVTAQRWAKEYRRATADRAKIIGSL